MSSKEKPTLGGTRIKTRKRNIAVPLDPASFSDVIAQIYTEHQGDLDLVAKDVESSDADFNRYGDTFFEVVFAGSCLVPGSVVPEEGVTRQPYAVLSGAPTREAILPHVSLVGKIIRRRPFMIKNLENVIRKLLLSLDFYGPEDRRKLAIFTSLAFSKKLSGLQPDTVFNSLTNDALVNKGTPLAFITEVLKDFLSDNSLDDLVTLLKRAKMEDRLLELFPMQRRTPEAFSEHFSKEGVDVLVDYNRKKVLDAKLKELLELLVDLISSGADPKEAVDLVKARKKEAVALPDKEVMCIAWQAMMDAVEWGGKNQQQVTNLLLRQVKNWSKLLASICTSGKLELELMYKIQIHCYEDNKFMKSFPDIIRGLYESEVLAEDTILDWFRKGTNPKGRQVFVQSLQPFVKWLEEAEEED